MTNDTVQQDPATGRRKFLTTAGVVAAGMLATGMLTPAPALAVTPALKFSNIPGTGDIKVVNFALALEDLEADLYVQALQRLTTGGTNKLGKKITGLNLSPNQPDVAYVKEFGVVERQHRDLLRATLGSAAITQFKYDFNMQNLTRKQVVDLIYTAERTGVGAYLGAIPFFQTRTYLQLAGSIQGTEARHTAVIAAVLNRLFREGLEVAPLASDNSGIDRPIQPDVVLAAISPFIVV